MKHGPTWRARSVAFCDMVVVWRRMRLPGDMVWAAGALLMAFDFREKLKPLSGGERQ